MSTPGDIKTIKATIAEKKESLAKTEAEIKSQREEKKRFGEQYCQGMPFVGRTADDGKKDLEKYAKLRGASAIDNIKFPAGRSYAKAHNAIIKLKAKKKKISDEIIVLQRQLGDAFAATGGGGGGGGGDAPASADGSIAAMLSSILIRMGELDVKVDSMDKRIRSVENGIISKVDKIYRAVRLKSALGLREALSKTGGLADMIKESGGFAQFVADCGGLSALVARVGGFEAFLKLVGGFKALLKVAGGFSALFRSVGGFDTLVRSVGGFDTLVRSVGGFETFFLGARGAGEVVRSAGGFEALIRSGILVTVDSVDHMKRLASKKSDVVVHKGGKYTATKAKSAGWDDKDALSLHCDGIQHVMCVERGNSSYTFSEYGRAYAWRGS